MCKGTFAAVQFKKRLERRGVKTYIHRATKGYGANPYIETTKPIVVVSAPGPGSGKMGTCLSQLYHDHRRGLASGYSKFETFPIWNLPLKHPVNIAYEAATADLGDVNLVDSYIRKSAIKHNVAYITTVAAAVAAEGIVAWLAGQAPIRSLQEWHGDLGERP